MENMVTCLTKSIGTTVPAKTRPVLMVNGQLFFLEHAGELHIVTLRRVKEWV
jgi:hypothetical protein